MRKRNVRMTAILHARGPTSREIRFQHALASDHGAPPRGPDLLRAASHTVPSANSLQRNGFTKMRRHEEISSFFRSRRDVYTARTRICQARSTHSTHAMHLPLSAKPSAHAHARIPHIE